MDGICGRCNEPREHCVCGELHPPNDPLLESERPYVAAAIVLHLSWLRSMYAVGRALYLTYPTEHAWTGVMDDPVFLAEVAAYARVVDDIRMHTQAGDPFDLDALEDSFSAHRDLALDALRLTAERLGITADDLLAVLVRA